MAAPKYEFTRQNSPHKVTRIQLELVDFTLTLSTHDGQDCIVSDEIQVQTILNQAREYNRIVDEDLNGSDGGGNNDNRVEIEIKLDPVNSVNTYRIQA